MSAATRQDIERWLDKLYADDSLTHMIVACDTFDWSDYPVYVSKDEDVHEKVQPIRDGENMAQLMEVYSRNHDRDEQLAERRAFHYD